MMKIKEIQIDNLFGIFNHLIPIDEVHKIAIIFSPNGFGKTNILKMLYHLYNFEFDELIKIKFEKFILRYNDNSELIIEQNFDSSDPNQNSLLFYQKDTNNSEFRYLEQERDDLSETLILEYIEKFIPVLSRVDMNQWQEKETGKKYNLAGVLENFGEKLPSQLRLDLEYIITKFMGDWLYDLLHDINIQLIDTRRQFTHTETEDHQVEMSVELASNNLKKAIQGVRDEAESIGQDKESTFPFRLMEEFKNSESVDVSILKNKLKTISNKRDELMHTGILDIPRMTSRKQNLMDIKIDETNKHVLEVYSDDVLEKFSIFEDLYIKIKLFQEIIDSQFTFKSVKIDKEDGIVIVVKNPRSKESIKIQTSKLSSGEQHLIILFFNLIFQAKPNSVILIDEPEISLHIAWQVEFFDNIHKIAELNNLNFIVATHSPQIINDKWHCTVDLAKSMEE